MYHPNIDLEGNVCLNILREDWKPVLTVNSIVYGLQYLFLVSIKRFVFLTVCVTVVAKFLIDIKERIKLLHVYSLQCEILSII